MGKFGSHKLKKEEFNVCLGAHNISEPYEKSRITASVAAMHIHPDWNIKLDTHDADIALLELQHEVYFNGYIQPICLSKLDTPSSTIKLGYITGFGKSERANVEDIERRAATPILSYHKCGANSKIHAALLSHRAFCGGFANGTGACTGDSGSGLIVVHDGRHYLRGIVSVALLGELNDCNVREYSVFTDIHGFYGWIMTGMDDNRWIIEITKK